MTSFKTDIAPMLAPYRANMMWRFDITDYDTVKTNANTAWGLDYIPGAGMSTAVRIVIVPDANISLIGVGAVVF